MRFRVFWTVVVAFLSAPIHAQAYDLKVVQTALTEMGYTPGPIDGQSGPKTRHALAAFFDRTNVAFDGQLDDARAQFVLEFRNFALRPTDLLIGLITQQISPETLSDEEICETLRVLPFRPTFEELNARGTSCPDLTIPLNLDLPKKYGGLAEVEAYAERHQIIVPEFNLENVPPVYPDYEEARRAFNLYNGGFSREFANSAKHDKGMDFCKAWLPTVRQIMSDPSKNLDGTGSWGENTIADAQVTCQGRMVFTYLEALNEDDAVAKPAIAAFKYFIEEWVRNDAPRNLYFDTEGANTNFSYILLLNQAMAGVEVLWDALDWSPEMRQAYFDWVRRRVDEITPIELFNPAGDGYCARPLDHKFMSDECMNAAALAAQVTLRAGILLQSPDLVRRGYLTFHRYLSTVRPDGSPAFDSLRSCFAADYVAWAAMFSNDFLFHWQRISKLDWDLSVNGGGTIKAMMEYALSVVEEPDLVNEYAVDIGYAECLDENGNLKQNESNDPLQFFAVYLAEFNPAALNDLRGEVRRRHDYSRGGGPNYEIPIFLTGMSDS